MEYNICYAGSTHNLAQFGYETGRLSGNRQLLIQQWGSHHFL